MIRAHFAPDTSAERAPFQCMGFNNSKQLLDEAEHDIKNYSDRGQCYLPKRS
jgi:hypothetical protein